MKEGANLVKLAEMQAQEHKETLETLVPFHKVNDKVSLTGSHNANSLATLHPQDQEQGTDLSSFQDLEGISLDFGSWLDQESLQQFQQFFSEESHSPQANPVFTPPSSLVASPKNSSSPILSTPRFVNFPSLQDVVRNQDQIKFSLNLPNFAKKQKLSEAVASSPIPSPAPSVPMTPATPVTPKAIPSPSPSIISTTKKEPVPVKKTSVVKSTTNLTKMEKFPAYQVVDFKHVLYNLLVDQHNAPNEASFLLPVRFEESGLVRTGFRFNPEMNAERCLAELYAKHIRKVDLTRENLHSTIAEDLNKYYYRSAMELLSKYFEKRDRSTFLDESSDSPLFIPGETLEAADQRLRTIKVRGKKRKVDSLN